MIFLCVVIISIAIFMLIKKYLSKEKFGSPDKAIGGFKGCPSCQTGIGVYSDEVAHFVKGYPNALYATPTIIDSSQVGFSTNSIVNRNQYSDFYDSVGNRRINPNFKFFTKFRGLELNPAVYSEPQYSFSKI